MTVHNCPHCACSTDKQIREKMRIDGHTCIWISEFEYNKHNGYLKIHCNMCDKERESNK